MKAGDVNRKTFIRTERGAAASIPRRASPSSGARSGPHGGVRRRQVLRHDRLREGPADRGVAVPEIAAELIIPTGKNNGSNPSVASVYRALADTGATPAHDDDGPNSALRR
ncbi:hypothetical protein GCM10020220_001170 [Nonomuraea rubra]